MISFPIYLTRILSSMLCGLITIAVLLVELHFYKVDCLWQTIVYIGKLSHTVHIIFFSGVFFIGELVTGVAEVFVFDPMFSNARKTCDANGKLENVVGFNKKDTRTIKFRNLIEFSKSDSATFALSEMYFNIHRILGGLFIVFLLLLVLPLILCFKGYHTTCINFILLLICNLFLICFLYTQAWKQRMFANFLIFYRSHNQQSTSLIN